MLYDMTCHTTKCCVINVVKLFPTAYHRIDCCKFLTLSNQKSGAQWLSGRVLDSRPKGRWFEPHRRHCVVVLEQDTFILA